MNELSLLRRQWVFALSTVHLWCIVVVFSPESVLRYDIIMVDCCELCTCEASVAMELSSVLAPIDNLQFSQTRDFRSYTGQCVTQNLTFRQSGYSNWNFLHIYLRTFVCSTRNRTHDPRVLSSTLNDSTMESVCMATLSIYAGWL